MENFIKITSGNSLILGVNEAKDFLDTIIGEVGEEYKIEVIQMTRKEFHELPEFDGF